VVIILIVIVLMIVVEYSRYHLNRHNSILNKDISIAISIVTTISRTTPIILTTTTN